MIRHANQCDRMMVMLSNIISYYEIHRLARESQTEIIGVDSTEREPGMGLWKKNTNSVRKDTGVKLVPKYRHKKLDECVRKMTWKASR